MSHYYAYDKDGRTVTHLRLCDIYQFRGFCFEWHDYLGLTRYRKSDMTPTFTMSKKFLDAFEEWFKLPEDEQAKFQIRG